MYLNKIKFPDSQEITKYINFQIIQQMFTFIFVYCSYFKVKNGTEMYGNHYPGNMTTIL